MSIEEESGVYKFYSGDKLLDHASVNTDPRESKITYLSEDEFRDYLQEIKFEGSYFNISAYEDFSAAVHQARFGSELWKLFLIIALILALTEMLIARSAKKDLIDVN